MSESTTPVTVDVLRIATTIWRGEHMKGRGFSACLEAALAAAVPVLLATERERVLRELVAEVEAIDVIGTTPAGGCTAEDVARYGASALSQPMLSAHQGRVAFVTFLRARIARTTTEDRT
jgi:hypothetical protein